MSATQMRVILLALCVFWTVCGFGIGWHTRALRDLRLGQAWDLDGDDD